jgi:hypothetical protein
MYTLRKYVQPTGDDQFLRDYGAEMLVETARLWLDLGFYSHTKGGKFCINGVVCTPFDRTGSLVALSTEAKKFSWGEEFQA